ncbi:1178_t:CDS:2, partial [Gigaspora margarita]
KTLQTTTFDLSIHTPSSAISTSTPLTQPIVLPAQSLANPLSNINTNKTFQTFQTQSSVIHTYSSKLKSQTNPLSLTLGPLTSTETLQYSSIDIDNTSNLANEANNFYKIKNNAESNINRNTFYFYSFFNEYLKA